MTEEQKLYNSWTKEQIYLAYLSEHKTRKKLNKELNKVRLDLKQLKFHLKQLIK